jgi:hypothetical protein
VITLCRQAVTETGKTPLQTTRLTARFSRSLREIAEAGMVRGNTSAVQRFMPGHVISAHLGPPERDTALRHEVCCCRMERLLPWQ